MAALAGALGAGLSAMVANLTVGKKGYEANYAALSEMADSAQGIKDELLKAVDRDTEAFNAVMEASRLPKASDEQRVYRDERLKSASETAALVPLHTAEYCLLAMKSCLVAVTAGNRNSVSDGAAGAIMACAGLESALLNVRINLAGMADSSFTKDLLEKCGLLQAEAAALKAQILEIAEKSLGK